MKDSKAGVVIVTGAAGNLGSSVARRLAASGVRLSLWDRDLARLTALGIDADLAEVDVGDEASVRREVDRLAAQGPIAGLVATVGGYLGGKQAVDTELADLQGMFAVNVHSFYCCAKEVARPMAAQGVGSIVCVSSSAAHGAGPGQAAYSAAKAAVSSLTRSLAAELKGSGVRVNAVLPGTMDTPQNRAWMAPDDLAKAVPTEHVAESIAFLLSDAAASVTGAELPVSGRQ